MFEDDILLVQRVHLRLRQRTDRMYITIIEGLPYHLNIRRVLKGIKKKFSCNGTIKEDNIIQLTGDQRCGLVEWLVDEKILNRDDIIIHG